MQVCTKASFEGIANRFRPEYSTPHQAILTTGSQVGIFFSLISWICFSDLIVNIFRKSYIFYRQLFKPHLPHEKKK